MTKDIFILLISFWLKMTESYLQIHLGAFLPEIITLLFPLSTFMCHVVFEIKKVDEYGLL